MKRILFLSGLLFPAILLHGQTKNFIDQPYIAVAGYADTLVTPDEIFIKIAISEKDTKGKVSVETLESSMIEALKGLGIDVEKNLVVNDMASNFKTYFLKSKDVLKTRQYTLKVTDANTAGKVFVKLEDLGIANTSIDHVDLSSKEEIQQQIQSKAVVTARRRAVALTEPLGQTVGKAILITETTARPVMNSLGANLSEVVVTGYASGIKSKQQPDISFEKIKIEANVNVTFILQ